MIVSDWQKQGNQFTLKVEIPVNTTATIYFPATKSSIVKENNKKITSLVYKDGQAIIKSGSGVYHFTVD